MKQIWRALPWIGWGLTATLLAATWITGTDVVVALALAAYCRM